MAKQAKKSASQVAQKWSANLQAATQSIQQGVNAVTTSPTQLAAANVNGYLQGVQQAVSSGKWQQRLQAVSLNDWKTAMLNKGVPHIQTGAVQGQSKVQQVFGPLLDYVYNVRDQVNAANPRGSLAQNLQRANAFATAMHNYNKS